MTDGAATGMGAKQATILPADGKDAHSMPTARNSQNARRPWLSAARRCSLITFCYDSEFL
jgi:hypothetical protein